MIKKLFSHTAIYGLAPQIPKIAGVLALPIITSHLTVVDFGIYGLISAIVGAITVLANLGLMVVVTNSFYKIPNQFKWAWRQIYGFLILWNIPYAILLAGVIYYFIPHEAVNNTWPIIILNVMPVVFFGPTANLGSLYYQLNQKPMQIAVRSVVVGFVAVGLNIYFIAVKEMGYMGWFLAAAISQMLNQLSYWVPLNRVLKITPIFNFKRRFIKRQLEISLPTLPHYYSNYLLNVSDRVVMNITKVPIGNIGLYNASNTVGNIVQIVGNASGQAISPILFKCYKDNNTTVEKNLIFTLQAAFLAGTFLCSLWLKELFYLLIKNNALREVYPLGIIIVMAYNYRPMYYAASNRLFFTEKTKVLVKITFAAGTVNLILNFIFIPIWGYPVAAYTTYVGLMYMGYSGFYLREFKESCNVNYRPIMWLCITVVVSAAAYFCVEMGQILKILISIVVMVATGLIIVSINNYSKSILKMIGFK